MNLNERLDRMFDEYQRQRDNLADIQQRMKEISSTATSPRREVSVMVGPNGVLTGIKFPTGAAKRLTPADLADLIMATYEEAKEAVADQAAAILAPAMPDGVDANTLVRGTADTDAYMPAEPRMTTSIREILGRPDA